MDNFYTTLKNLNDIDYLKKNINNFNNLNDETIKLLFHDTDIIPDLKKIIVQSCYERIKILPFDIFLNALFYMDNADLFTNNYKDRINSLTYAELISLIYDSDLNIECLFEITKMEVFQKYLIDEKENKIGTKLQIFKILKEIYLSNGNLDILNSLGIQIIEILKEPLNDMGDIELLINYYLNKIIEKNNDINFDNNINIIGISLINYYLKNHKQLNSKMIEFYILFRLKSLNLQSYCKKIIITDQDSSTFGNFLESTETLTIFIKYLSKRFEELKEKYSIQKSDDEMNDILNLILLQNISHELGHIVKHREVENFLNTESNFKKIQKNASLYYWYKNGLLRLHLGYEKYQQLHDDFIEEIREDIFSIVDSSIQIEKYFNTSFSKLQLQNLSRFYSELILRYYGGTSDNGKNIITPMQKFDNLFNQYFSNVPNLQNQETNFTTDVIINNLLLGDLIPDYVFETILEIVNGQIITTNIYSEILQTIIKNQSFDSEEALEIKNI